MQWFERTRAVEMIRMNHHFDIAGLEIFHAAFQNKPAAIDEDEIGQDILDFFDLMRRDNDGATAVEVIVEQRIVELFRSEEHTSELQSRGHLVCRLLLEKKNI